MAPNRGRAGAIIVSNDKGNQSSSTVEVVYLTTQPKHDLPTHVVIRATGKESIALCEQVTTVSLERVGDFCGECTKTEMQHIDIALMVSLGDVQPANKPAKPAEAPLAEKGNTELEKKLVSAESKLTLFRSMYSELLQQITAR